MLNLAEISTSNYVSIMPFYKSEDSSNLKIIGEI